MVDHRADEDRDFRVYVDPQDDRGLSWSETFDRIKAWLFERPILPNVPSGSASKHTKPLIATTPRRIALGISGLWALILGTYGLGYFLRLDAVDGSTRFLPTLDFLFFAFAIAGPIAMVWVVVLLLERAAALANSIEAQSESALALAATLANLNDSVDALSAGTTGRLEQACDRMEREASASVAALDRNLKESTIRLESALIDSVTLLHERSQERDEKMRATFDGQRAEFEHRLGDDAHRLALAIETEVDALRQTRDLLAQKIEEGFQRSRSRVDEAVGEVFSRQQAGLAETNQRVHTAVSGFADKLIELRDLQARMVEEDLATPLEEISRRLEDTRKSLAAHPPASSEALADLLGKAAQNLVRVERKAIEESVRRIAGLEEQASQMLDAIDRTSRLNPYMDDARTDAEIEHDVSLSEPPSLPFNTLPMSATRLQLDWSAVVQVLTGTQARPGLRHILEKMKSDADVAAVLLLTDQVAEELRHDKVFLEDLSVEHVSAPLWARFSRGERGGDLVSLAGISDDVSAAIVRARLRNAKGFRTLSLRLMIAYARLLERAVDDMGVDQRLVELAETRSGRAFMLIGGLTGTFEHPVPLAPELADV